MCVESIQGQFCVFQMLLHLKHISIFLCISDADPFKRHFSFFVCISDAAPFKGYFNFLVCISDAAALKGFLTEDDESNP